MIEAIGNWFVTNVVAGQLEICYHQWIHSAHVAILKRSGNCDTVDSGSVQQRQKVLRYSVHTYV